MSELRTFIPGICFILLLSLHLAAATPQIFRLVSEEPRDLDPINDLGSTPVRNLFEGLVARDPKTAEPIPAAAEKWIRSEDGKRWTFTIRQNAKWSNGDPVTAQDFVNSWIRMLTPSNAAMNAYFAYSIRNARGFNRGDVKDPKQLGFKALSTQVLSVELEDPIPYFLELLDNPCFFPVHENTVKKFKGNWTRPDHIVSNGPFMLQEWRLNHVMTLIPNPHYWDRQNIKLEQIRILATESQTLPEKLFRTKQIDVSPVPQASLDSWRHDKGGAFHSEPWFNVSFVVANLKKPPLNDRRFRQALALALDREKLVKYVTRGNEEPAGSFSVSMGTYQPVTKIPLDGSGVVRAKALMKEMGFTSAEKVPNITLIFYHDENVRNIVEALQGMWQQNLGIKIKLQAEEKKVYIDDLRTKNFDIAYSGWSADYPDPSAFLDLWMTGAGNNDAGFSNTEYDGLLKEALKQPKEDARFAIFHKAEEILANEMPAVPIRFGRKNYLLNPKVRGLYPNSQNIHPLKYVWIGE